MLNSLIINYMYLFIVGVLKTLERTESYMTSVSTAVTESQHEYMCHISYSSVWTS